MGLWQRPRARPATVATLPPRRGPPNVRFSMARSVRFSAAIDTSAPNRFLEEADSHMPLWSPAIPFASEASLPAPGH